MSISLDTVAARLEKPVGTVIPDFEPRQSTLCQCLRRYADILCSLQTIEKRQRPVQIDTFLTCSNLVLKMTENQLRCSHCLHDSCVAMQLVMVFQTIFTWSQGQCHSSGTPAPDLRLTLGQHEMTEDEYNFVKNALVARVLEKTSTFLKSVVSRIEHLRLSRQGKQSWGYEGAEFGNVQQLVGSLLQSSIVLSNRLTSGESRSRQLTKT